MYMNNIMATATYNTIMNQYRIEEAFQCDAGGSSLGAILLGSCLKQKYIKDIHEEENVNM